MTKLSHEEEKALLVFVKDWLKSHGYTQKDLANELNLKSSRTSEISLKVKELYKKGGIFNIAKNLIKIEQNWLTNISTNSQENFHNKEFNQLDINSPENEGKLSSKLDQNSFEDETQSYNQLDLDSVVNQINKETC